MPGSKMTTDMGHYLYLINSKIANCELCNSLCLFAICHYHPCCYVFLKLCLVIVQWSSPFSLKKNIGVEFYLKEHSYFFQWRRYTFSTENHWLRTNNEIWNFGSIWQKTYAVHKVWDWELIFGPAVQAISSPGIPSPCNKWFPTFHV